MHRQQVRSVGDESFAFLRSCQVRPHTMHQVLHTIKTGPERFRHDAGEWLLVENPAEKRKESGAAGAHREDFRQTSRQLSYVKASD